MVTFSILTIVAIFTQISLFNLNEQFHYIDLGQ